MRLINVNTLQLEEFVGDSIPRYAILSHTWGPDELSLQDFKSCIHDPMSPFRFTGGFEKIENACEKARARQMAYLWVDTCCIDKTSSAELTEAINSMFQWYRDAHVCIVYLEDFRSALEEEVDLHLLGGCRWFTRGWCLQELLAPKNNMFYDRNWVYFVDKLTIVGALSHITGIDKDVLNGQSSFSNYPLACRMSWGSRRVTTRIEDQAYCLLGLLQVNMPMLYGEGPRAFIRLQEELLRSHEDSSIFVWKDSDSQSLYQPMLAPRISCFTDGGSLKYGFGIFSSMEPMFSHTNRGIRITSPNLTLIARQRMDQRDNGSYLLVLDTLRGHDDSTVAIMLQKVGPSRYMRLNESYRVDDVVSRLQDDPIKQEDDIYIFQNLDVAQSRLTPSLQAGVWRLTVECRGTLKNLRDAPYQEIEPRAAWDSANSRFLASHDREFAGYIKMYPTGMRDWDASRTTSFVLLLKSRRTHWRDPTSRHQAKAWLMNGVHWRDFERSKQKLQSVINRATMHRKSIRLDMSTADTKAYKVGSITILVTFEQGGIIIEGLDD